MSPFLAARLMVDSPAMDAKTLRTLEYDRILERLAVYSAFAVSAEKARALQPSTDLETARRWLMQVDEARLLLEAQPSTSIGGARDVRQAAEAAQRGVVLTPSDLLDVKYTLISARNLARLFEQSAGQFPQLAAIAAELPTGLGLVDAISKAISERGELLDSASPKLATIRRDLGVAHERLNSRMQRLLKDPKIVPFLQEALITQRDGRYVLPLRAEAKGRIKAVVHDQSSSGATLFVEPLQVVELNNAWRQLQLDERDEERRILAELSGRVGEQAPTLLAAVETLAALDLAFARAKYAEDLGAVAPTLHPIKPHKDSPHPGVVLRLWQARHPLLEPETVVPIDVELHPQNYALVITGPNTGGKTVTLKTVGLLALMAQSGLHIPVQSGSELSLFEAVYADIGDEQSIEQSLSTFSGHITNIIGIMAHADQRSLVILDELGAGTDPQEGAALARAILDYLLERGITTLVATHYPELKAYAHATPGVVNASVEFDLETLRPTYHLTIGLPGRSNALSIAQRLGLDESIVEAARETINPADLRADDLLDEIHRQRDLIRQARQQTETARREAEELRAELAERLEGIEDERLEILEDARQQTQTEIEALKKELQDARRKLARAQQPLEVIEQVAQQVEALEATVEQPTVRREVPESAPSRPVRLGDRVRLRSLGKEGVVTALGEEELEVQVGVLRVRARLVDIELLGAAQVADLPAEVDVTVAGYKPQSPGVEVSLRGQRVDEALENLERHLDAAYVVGLPYVRIIHGKGTGKLRQMVRRELKRNPHVDRYETAAPNEGGEGVTVAFLKGG